jgi:cytochrome c oxidase subunit 2
MLFGPILILVVVAACGLFAVRPAWFPLPISSEALLYDHQFSRTLWIIGIAFVAAQILLAYAALTRSHSAAPKSRWLEIGWTVVTAAVFLTLAGLGSRGWARTPGSPVGKEVIEVYSRQFAWNFRYPGADGRFGKTRIDLISDSGGNPLGLDPSDPNGEDDIVTASLRIPAGRDVLLLLHSRDVIHDFFVRELRTKQDIVPGMEIPLEIHVDRAGEYEIACAELCGLGHSQMRSFMIVMTGGDFDRWKRAQMSRK